MKEEARHHLRRSRRLLEMVKARAEVELPEVVASTAYYAMYHAAMALFAELGVVKPKSHSGLVTRLSQLDRENALNAREQIARLSRGLDRRLIADYEAQDTLTLEHARAARDEAMAFVDFCERLIDVS